MKLSVIIPVYNLEDFVTPCLESVLSQECNFSYEVIVCDDGSSDKTAIQLAQMKSNYPELHILKNDPNIGLVKSLSRLLSACQGEYIAYLDGDDVALPNKLQVLVDYLEQHPECAIAYHEAEVFDSDSGKVLKHFSRDYYNASYIPQRASIVDLIRYGTFLQASSIAFRRHKFLLAALNHDCEIICDYPWHILNAGYIGGTIDRIDVILGRYRVHSQSFGAQTSRDMSRRLKVTAELEHSCSLALQFGIKPEIVHEGIAHVRFAAALYFLKCGEDELFSEMICRSAEFKYFFDQRHKKAYSYSTQPQKLRNYLSWL